MNMSVFMSDFIAAKTSWRNWRLFNKELWRLLARFWLRIFMLNSKNMPHFDLTFGNGEQDKILFQGLSLSKSKGVEQDPYTKKKKKSVDTSDCSLERGIVCSRRWPYNMWQMLLLIFMLILIKWLQKVNSIFRAGSAASCFASTILCCWNGMNWGKTYVSQFYNSYFTKMKIWESSWTVSHPLICCQAGVLTCTSTAPIMGTGQWEDCQENAEKNGEAWLYFLLQNVYKVF